MALSSPTVLIFPFEFMAVSSLILFEDRADFPHCCMGVIIVVHDDHRANGAAAEAGHGLQRELLVLGSLAGFDFQPPLELIEYSRGPPHMAGCALADGADVLAAGCQAKGSIERGHRNHIRERNPQRLSDEPQTLLREIPVLGLDLLKDSDQALLLSLVLIDKRPKLFFLQGHGVSPLERITGTVNPLK